MKILSIGNSFSQDAQKYLYKIASQEGVDLKTVNLYIGGCTLRTHYLNILDDKALYTLEFNGQDTGIKVSIKQVLASVDWDIVTLQQASMLSPKEESYMPYIEEVAKYVRLYCPQAEIFIHETWAYEDGCERLQKLGYHNAQEMLCDVQKSYKKVAKIVNADGIIPCGTAMMKAISLGVGKIHRDTYHAALGAGRYLLALTWFKKLTGMDISENSFADFQEEVTDEQRAIIIKAVNSVVK